MCIRHVNSVRDHFATDQGVEKLTFPESKQAWLRNITDISGTACLIFIATEMIAFWYFTQNQLFAENATPVIP